MKRFIAVLVLTCILCLSSVGCSGELTSKKKIIKLYGENEAAFLEAAETGDFTALESMKGVLKVIMYDDHAAICCGGSGMGANTDYYEIWWTEKKIESVLLGQLASGYDVIPDGNGARYKEKEGDNEFYAEPLGNGYYYVELHF
ncbi:MAG: hypothetical protein J5772_01765 [Clostridia bacterium]|nr:hypothetical protein [Clostridia bacterium]